MVSKEIIFEDLSNPIGFFGENDIFIKMIEQAFDIEIFPRGNELRLKGESEKIVEAEKALQLMFYQIQKGKNITKNDVKYIVDQVSQDSSVNENEIESGIIKIPKNNRTIKPRTAVQNKYLKKIKNNSITFGIGPAGTGKTYLAVACGVYSLLSEQKHKLILTRPVVEAGESLGYLPGDLIQKVNPYLRPLFDAILDMISYEDFIRLKEREQIEIAPLAYMRGRTLNNAFIILDEAQNTSIAQLKMFLTRLGETSKVVITGDLTQIDLPKKVESGLIFANKVLKQINELKFVYFTVSDIIRHPLVKKIVEAFEKHKK